jgi:hypothetical protein
MISQYFTGGLCALDKSPIAAVGIADKSMFDYVTRRFNASPAELKKPEGLDLR